MCGLYLDPDLGKKETVKLFMTFMNLEILTRYLILRNEFWCNNSVVGVSVCDVYIFKFLFFRDT